MKVLPARHYVEPSTVYAVHVLYKTLTSNGSILVRKYCDLEWRFDCEWRNTGDRSRVQEVQLAQAQNL